MRIYTVAPCYPVTRFHATLSSFLETKSNVACASKSTGSHATQRGWDHYSTSSTTSVSITQRQSIHELLQSYSRRFFLHAPQIAQRCKTIPFAVWYVCDLSCFTNIHRHLCCSHNNANIRFACSAALSRGCFHLCLPQPHSERAINGHDLRKLFFE